jgi:protein-ribulosamine 3-kinase
MYQGIVEAISQHLKQPLSIIDAQPIAGGSINQVTRITLDNQSQYLLKTQSGRVAKNTFQIEYESLALLSAAQAVRVPQALVVDQNFLVLEYIQPGTRAADWEESLGRQLAMLHKNTSRKGFGFYCNNYLGTTVQLNDWQSCWLDFWREQRLGKQLQLYAERAGKDALMVKGEKLMHALDKLLADVQEPAVLLHGDLWSGNAMADQQGQPVIFDPASYYGQREAEFGIMRLFGGFGRRCEAAYQEIWPFEAGYEERFRLYQLYHELNHLNLFGASYYAACMASMDALL